jgi:hypothetical protein
MNPVHACYAALACYVIAHKAQKRPAVQRLKVRCHSDGDLNPLPETRGYIGTINTTPAAIKHEGNGIQRSFMGPVLLLINATRMDKQ